MLGRRILLINSPPVSGVAFTRQGRCQEREEVLGAAKPPYSLAVIAALLRARGHELRLVDQTASRLTTEALIDQLTRDRFSPTLVLFHSIFPTLNADAREAAKLKRAFGAALVSIGPHASAAPRESMLRAPDVDAMVVGEPEDAVLELAGLASLDQADRVASLTVRRGDSILPHRARGTFAAFPSMPYPAWDLLPLRHYRVPLHNAPYLMVETSRGCPYSCDFCIAPIHQGHQFRERAAAALVDEMEEGTRRFGVDHFYLWGDTITASPHSFERLCDELIARRLRVRWFGNARADNLQSRDFVAKLRQSGCWMLAFGIESESDDVRRDMLKKLERDKIQLATGNLRAAGIKSFAFFILGHPSDTVASMERTARYACEVGPDFANFYPAVPYPGTLLHERCVREGLIASDDWSRLDYSHYVLRGNGLDEPTVMGAAQRAARRFFLRPSWIACHGLDLARLLLTSGPAVMRAGARLLRPAAGAGPAASNEVAPSAAVSDHADPAPAPNPPAPAGDASRP